MLHGILASLSEVTAQKTSSSISSLVVQNILQSLQHKFPFLGDIQYNDTHHILVPASVNSLDENEVSRAIEAIIRLVYMNLEKQAGDSFISELKQSTPDEIINQISDNGVDLELLQIEHHQLFKNNISNADATNNSMVEQNEDSMKNQMELGEESPTLAELRLLELLQKKDVDSSEAINHLQISLDTLNEMVNNLINNDLLQYISDDEVKLTNKAISYLAQNKGRYQ